MSFNWSVRESILDDPLMWALIGVKVVAGLALAFNYHSLQVALNEAGCSYMVETGLRIADQGVSP